MNERHKHWEQVYCTKADPDLSWFQDEPRMSLALIEALRPKPKRIIDVGGGQSALAGQLVARAVDKMCVLDVSSSAIARAQLRLGDAATKVTWVAGDVLDQQDLGEFDVWHDRAVFHFLTEAEDRQKYARAAARAVAPGGHLVIATFAPTGPERCSGLPVQRYDAESLAREFAPAFRLVDSTTESHATPWGRTQDFCYAVLKRDDQG